MSLYLCSRIIVTWHTSQIIIYVRNRFTRDLRPRQNTNNIIVVRRWAQYDFHTKRSFVPVSNTLKKYNNIIHRPNAPTSSLIQIERVETDSMYIVKKYAVHLMYSIARGYFLCKILLLHTHIVV